MSDLYEATKLAAKIIKKANDSLDGLEREMRIMGWKSEYRVIMWETVARAALIKASEAATQRERGQDAKQ